MQNEPELSVVLPAYLEEENLRLLLPRIRSTLEALQTRFEIVVVDTEKPIDRTPEACEVNHVRYVNRKGGNTYGDAIRTGIQEAKGEYVLFMDADGSHTPEFIPELFSLRRENDIVVASRYIPGGYTENSRLLVAMSRLLNFSYSLILNLKCNDVSNSFKLYRASLLKDLRLFCNHFDIIEEIFFKISKKQKNLRIKEVPFAFKKRMFGETKRNLFLFILTFLLTIIKLRLSIPDYWNKRLSVKKEPKPNET